MLPDEEYLSLLKGLNLRQRDFSITLFIAYNVKMNPFMRAGVGKSAVIKAIYQSLYRMLNLREEETPNDIRVLLCVYMGTAAFSTGGNTICSAFHKKMCLANQVMLAYQLNTFKIKYKYLKVVIIDGISMVGKKTLDFIDT